MKWLKLKFEKENIYWIFAALVLSLVLFLRVKFSLGVFLGFIICYLLIKHLEINLPEKFAPIWTALLLVGSSVFSMNLVQYLLLDEELRAKTSDAKLLLNVICCLVVYLVVQVFTNQAGVTCIISHLILMLLAGTNYYVFLFRGNEFIFSDVRSIQTGLSVAGTYTFTLDERAAHVILLTTLYVALMRKLKISIKKRWLMSIFAISLTILCVCYVGVKTEEVVTETWEQKGSYRNGYVLNFALSIRDYFVIEPEGYSDEVIAELEETYAGSSDKEKSAASVEKPTIIVVMSESYADFNVLGNLLTNKEVTPFYNSLNENIIKGYALSSVFGAKTPNSEWEFLTGNTMGFLPSGSVVYQQYMNEEPSSVVSYLKNIGYTCVSMHPYYENGWSRNTVYPKLGFDESYFIEHYDSTKMIREYISDQEFYKKIIERFESKASNEDLFIMSISMQNHGGYKETYDNFEEDVRSLGYNYPDANQYLSLLHESDKALEYFITYFETVEEPVEIVFFGDHLPSLDTNFYTGLNGKGLSGLTVDELEELYTVPFFIWTNYESEEEQVETTSLNYLSTLALQRAGLELPAYNQFLLALMEKIPAINARGYYSLSEGCYKHMEEATGEEAEWIQTYRILQYNNLFDKNKSEVFFPYME